MYILGNGTETRKSIAPDSTQITSANHAISDGEITFSADVSGLLIDTKEPSDRIENIPISIVSENELAWFKVDGNSLKAGKSYESGIHSLTMTDAGNDALESISAVRKFMKDNPGLKLTIDPSPADM